MSLRTVTTYRAAVDAFIDAAEWLSDVDLPGVMVLRNLADNLDAPGAAPQAALLSQFTMTFRDLRNRAPKEQGGSGDPLAEAMDQAASRQVDLFTAAAKAFEAQHAGD